MTMNLPRYSLALPTDPFDPGPFPNPQFQRSFFFLGFGFKKILNSKRMNQWLPVLAIILVISFLSGQSDASFLDFARKLTQNDNPKGNPEVSPSLSPLPSVNLKYEDAMKSSDAAKACEAAGSKCKIDEYNATTCVPPVGNGFQGSFLLVVNDGKSSLIMNITFRPTNESRENIEVPAQKVIQVNLTSNESRSSSIFVNAKTRNCTIKLGSSVLQPSYTSYLTPVNGTYLLFVVALFIGGTWACCKLVRRERHLDGIPYQELEMGHKETDFTLNQETANGWDESWDDDWDEEKAA